MWTSSRRANSSKASATEVKYCSDKCKKHKPSTAAGSLDVRIEDALLALLEGREVPVSIDEEDEQAERPPPVKASHKPKKGDPRIIVQLSELETAVFGDRSDPEKVYGRRKNRRARFIPQKGEWKSVDMEDEDSAQATAADHDDADTAGSLTDGSDDQVGGVSIHTHVRPSQTESDINFSAGGGERGWAEKIEETPEMLAKRREGQKRAEEKEVVKCAARRAIVFGLLTDAVPQQQSKKCGKKGRSNEQEDAAGGKVIRKCEALMNGQVVEPSFAKGDWSIRWRED